MVARLLIRAIVPRLETTKICQRCGRGIEWRKKWKDTWESVRYCSDACRRAKLQTSDLALEQAILSLLKSRAATSSICPSEAARLVFPADWAKQMEPARQAARRLVARGVIEITQQGKVVDPSTAKGPIRLRRGRAFPG
jgi:hypothetical protein